ncbi:unnamed protein product [Ostreobium quekettii]|uniref:Uncharacterized protein n=1 Tax=Ostreobium quekettii TaxID=121088 RepID=A0A8S1J8C2_9CHLO|nr:unnamed protein product [Ostreobium quekettii]
MRPPGKIAIGVAGGGRGSGTRAEISFSSPWGLGALRDRRGGRAALRAVVDGKGPEVGDEGEPWWKGLTRLVPRKLPAVYLLAKAKEGDVVTAVYALVAGSAVLAILFSPDLESGRVTDGVSLLGVFYVFSQSIERLLEPLKAYFRFGEAKKEVEAAGSAAMEEAIGELKKVVPAIEEGKVMEEVAKVGPEILGAIAAGIAEEEDGDDEEDQEADAQQPDRQQPNAERLDGEQPNTVLAADATVQVRSRGLDRVRRAAHKRAAMKEKKKAAKENVQNKVKDLQDVKEDVGRIKKNTAVIFWGMASALAMMLSLTAHIGLLHAVGLNPPPALDVIVTGLAVGAGTQPLNKIISVLKK